MGLHKGGLLSGGGGPATSLGPGATGSTLVLSGSSTALQFIATQVAGADAFLVTNNGARWHVGTGALDYFSSNGTIITFAGPVASGVASPGIAYSMLAGARISFDSDVGNATRIYKAGSGLLAMTGDLVPEISNSQDLGGSARLWRTIYSVANITTGTSTVGTALIFSSFLNDSAVAGNRTVNTVRGKNAIAAGSAVVTITNSFVTTASQVICTLEEADATLLYLLRCVPGAGSFTLTGNIAATADTTFSWVVLN